MAYPPPVKLVKAMRREYAEDAVNHGHMLLRTCAYYRSLEDPELGDQCNGSGLDHLHGRPIETDSVNAMISIFGTCYCPRLRLNE
jgi:hypothetical protein